MIYCLLDFRHEADMTRIRFLCKCLVANHQFMMQTQKKYVKMKTSSPQDGKSFAVFFLSIHSAIYYNLWFPLLIKMQTEYAQHCL